MTCADCCLVDFIRHILILFLVCGFASFALQFLMGEIELWAAGRRPHRKTLAEEIAEIEPGT